MKINDMAIYIEFENLDDRAILQINDFYCLECTFLAKCTTLIHYNIFNTSH